MISYKLTFVLLLTAFFSISVNRHRAVASDLPHCNEMENINLKCMGKGERVFASRIVYCKNLPLELGCNYINKK